MLKKYLYKTAIGLVVITSLLFVVSGGGFFKVSYGSGAGIPTFSPASGNFTAPTSVTISCSGNPLSTIYYSTNNATPDSSSTQYTGPISVTSTENIYAVCYYPGYAYSTIVTGYYYIGEQLAATPTFNPGPGVYTSIQTVTIACATASSTIYYTTNGTTPNPYPSSTTTAYSKPVSVATTETIEAICTAPNHYNSSIASAYYQINLQPTLEIPYNNTCIVSTGVVYSGLVTSCPGYISWLSISPYQNLSPGATITVEGGYVGPTIGAYCTYGTTNTGYYDDYYPNGSAMDTKVVVDNAGSQTQPGISDTLQPQTGNCNNDTTTGGWPGTGIFTTTITAPSSAGTYGVGSSIVAGGCTASDASNCELHLTYSVASAGGGGTITVGADRSALWLIQGMATSYSDPVPSTSATYTNVPPDTYTMYDQATGSTPPYGLSDSPTATSGSSCSGWTCDLIAGGTADYHLTTTTCSVSIETSVNGNVTNMTSLPMTFAGPLNSYSYTSTPQTPYSIADASGSTFTLTVPSTGSWNGYTTDYDGTDVTSNGILTSYSPTTLSPNPACSAGGSLRFVAKYLTRASLHVGTGS